MDIEKLIHCLQCCARVDAHNVGCDDCELEYCGPECQQLCWTAATTLFTLQAENEKLRAESIMHHNAADNYWHELNEYRQERNEALAELEQVKRALAMMWYAYDNKAGEFPHEYEIEAMQEAENVLGPWAECMPKYLRRGQKED